MNQVALFKFLTCIEFFNKWVKAIPRKNWTLCNFHIVCAKHFCKEDLKVNSTDICVNTRNSRPFSTLQRFRLLPNSVPKIFHSLPQYLSTPQSSVHTTSHCTTSARLEKQNFEIHQCNAEFLTQDSFSNFKTFNEKLKDALFPSGYVVVNAPLNTQFHFITTIANEDLAPKLNASV